MSALYYIVLIALALIGGFILFSKMSSNGKKLGNEETDKADQMAKEDKDWHQEPVIYEKKTIGDALEKAWELFQNPNTLDIVELDTETTGCQLSLENQDSKQKVQVAYVFKVDLKKLNVPDYIQEQYDGDILYLYYDWPEDKKLISEQVQEVLGGTLENYVNFHYWDN